MSGQGSENESEVIRDRIFSTLHKVVSEFDRDDRFLFVLLKFKRDGTLFSIGGAPSRFAKYFEAMDAGASKSGLKFEEFVDALKDIMYKEHDWDDSFIAVHDGREGLVLVYHNRDKPGTEDYDEAIMLREKFFKGNGYAVFDINSATVEFNSSVRPYTFSVTSSRLFIALFEILANRRDVDNIYTTKIGNNGDAFILSFYNMDDYILRELIEKYA